MHDGSARSIRDIAHLYISTPRVGGEGRRILVAGVDRETFPGFHVANLAAAFRTQSHDVRVVELSELLVNAARFLALPPQVYAAPPGARPAPSARALDGIEVWFSSPPGAGGRTVDLIHAPPLDDRPAFERCVAAHPGVEMLLIVDRWRDVPRRLFASTRTPQLLMVSRDRPGPDFAVAATVSRWRRSLSDTVPAAVRDTQSRLSRSYIECARRLAAGAGRTGRYDDRRPDARSGAGAG